MDVMKKKTGSRFFFSFWGYLKCFTWLVLTALYGGNGVKEYVSPEIVDWPPRTYTVALVAMGALFTVIPEI